MMNRSVFRSSPLMQKMMEGSSTAATGWWNVYDNGQIQVLPSSSPSLASIPYNYPLPSFPWHDTQDLQESWSQLLLGGLVVEDGICNFNTHSQTKKMENNYWEDQVLLLESSNAQMVDVKQESYERRRYLRGHGKEKTLSSPATNKGDLIRHPKLDNSSECNSTGTGSALKKARMGGSSAQSSFKVRKEKLGDRITALHQLVSPFGKTDTASVLLEVIGYIKFLQTQIKALSFPYLGNCTSVSKTGNIECGISEERKDLKSSGLCLVPISFTMHVVTDNGVDYWSPTLAVMFQ